MDAAFHSRNGGRGADLLLRHCSELSHVDDERPTPFQRLERLVGLDLARLLVGALARRGGPGTRL